jgi:hypothetical protein
MSGDEILEGLFGSSWRSINEWDMIRKKSKKRKLRGTDDTTNLAQLLAFFD